MNGYPPMLKVVLLANIDILVILAKHSPGTGRDTHRIHSGYPIQLYQNCPFYIGAVAKAGYAGAMQLLQTTSELQVTEA